MSKTTIDHLFLVFVSLSAAILIAVPAGIVAAKNRLAGQLILGTAEVLQTIPGLALLVFMGAVFVAIGLPMIGPWPVIVALFLYSLLPIIRNTVAGLKDVPVTLNESAVALGLPPQARLRLIELPMASKTIIAGIKTTAVINVGYAALGGLVGAGGYGQPIMTGLRLNRLDLMMEGALPAACLALLVKGLFELIERYVVPELIVLAEATARIRNTIRWLPLLFVFVAGGYYAAGQLAFAELPLGRGFVLIALLHLVAFAWLLFLARRSRFARRARWEQVPEA